MVGRARVIVALVSAFATGIIGSAAPAIGAENAAPYPTRPVHVIVPVAPGGSTDAAARIIGEQLARSLGQPVVIDNRPGAGGNIGIEAAARSPADGYTVLVTTDRIASAPHVYHLALDPTDALVPVVEISRQPVVLAAHPSLGVATLGEPIALAKSQPGMDYAIGGGIGVQQHFVAAWFAKIAGIKLELPVPLFASNRDLIIRSASLHKMPAVYPFKYYAKAGGLMSYGIDVPDVFRRASAYADRIMKGERPGDLPIQAPVKFELTLNLKTAKAIGLNVPPTLLARADAVIE